MDLDLKQHVLDAIRDYLVENDLLESDASVSYAYIDSDCDLIVSCNRHGWVKTTYLELHSKEQLLELLGYVYLEGKFSAL